MKNVMNRVKSDEAAAVSSELLIVIVLAVFAALALFRFILKPVEDGATKTGSTITKIIGDLLDGNHPIGPKPQPE